MNRSSGYSLIELMISLAILTICVVAGGSVLSQSMQSERQFAGYSRDIEDCHRVLRAVEEDLRHATEVQSHIGKDVLTIEGKSVVYRLHDGVLSRRQAGRDLVLARSLAEFDLSEDEGLVQVRIQVRRRSRPASRRKALITTQVALRKRSS